MTIASPVVRIVAASLGTAALLLAGGCAREESPTASAAKPAPALVDQLLDLRAPRRNWKSPSALDMPPGRPLSAREVGRVFDDLEHGYATAVDIASLMRSREAADPARSRELAARRGIVRGIAAACSGDAGLVAVVLAGDDADAQRALLAAARVARLPLPLQSLEAVARSSDPRVVHAAERYLVDTDFPEMRPLVRALHPGEFLVFGDRIVPRRGQSPLDLWDDERVLAVEVRAPGGPDAIYALLTETMGSTDALYVRVRGKAAELVSRTDDASVARRTLRPEELQRLERFLAAEKVENLPPLHPMVFDGAHHTFVALDRSGGYRLDMANPGDEDGRDSAYARLVRLFQELEASRGPA